MKLPQLRRQWLGVCIALLSLPIAQWNANAGPPIPPNGPLTIPDNMAAQLPLDTIAHGIESYVDTAPAGGFTGIAYQSGTFVLFWKGTIPQEIRAVLEEGAHHAPVVVRSTRYSLKELDATERRLISVNHDRFGDSIIYVSLPATFDAIDVVVDQSRASATTNDALRATAAPIDARIVYGSPPRQASCPPTNCPYRWDDWPPFYGGDAVNAPNGLCSTSFEVWGPGSVTSMLTASHCGYNGSYRTPSTTANWEGTSISCCNSTDVTRITKGHSSGDYAPDIWTGPWTTTSYAPVRGQWSGASYGQVTCLNGGPSGESCHCTVYAVNVYASSGDGPGDWTDAGTGNAACAGEGDSGGAQYTYNGDGSLSAMGIIIELSGGPITCSGNPNLYPRDCTQYVFSTYVGSALSALGSSLVTG